MLPADLGDQWRSKPAQVGRRRGSGGIDILINNAGLTRDNLAMRMKDDEWDQVIAVNLTAAFRLSRAVLRGMMKKRWGRIIGITSVVGVTGNPGQANYAAAKAGMIGMSKSLAQEVASRNITVNCVAPGFIETQMTGALNEDQKARIMTAVPAGRLGQSDEIAAAVVYLASPEAAYVTPDHPSAVWLIALSETPALAKAGQTMLSDPRRRRAGHSQNEPRRGGIVRPKWPAIFRPAPDGAVIKGNSDERHCGTG